MVAGSIHREDQTIRHTQDTASLAGEYVCIELIGKMQREKIGEGNGQSD